MKKILLVLSIIVLTSSCYNYDGPTRPKKEIGKFIPIKRNNNKQEIIALESPEHLNSKQYLEQMAATIKRVLPSAQVKLLQDSILVLFPDNILYASSSILPMKDVNYEMSKLAGLLIKYNQTSILVSGHTDNVGDRKINKRISELRAQYIASLLISYKVPAERVNHWGLGGNSPIASNMIEGGLEKNRRVEFIVLSTIEED